MAIKEGWDFPSPANASTRAYTRERGQGVKSPAVGRDETPKNAPTSHSRANPRDGRYARNDEFRPMTPARNEAAEDSRTGRTAHNARQGFAKGGAVSDERQDKALVKAAIHKHERHDHPGEPLTKLAKGGNWIAGATQNKGALHRALGVPQGEKIPASKLEKAEHSKNPTMRKRAALAKTLKGFHSR